MVRITRDLHQSNRMRLPERASRPDGGRYRSGNHRFHRSHLRLGDRSACLVALISLAIALGTQPVRLAFATEEPSAETEWAGLHFRLSLDKSEYQFAEPVNISFTATNTNPTTYRLQFTSSCQFEFRVYQGDRLIHRLNEPCIGALTQVVLAPGETFVYSKTWNQIAFPNSLSLRQSIWPGRYVLEGRLSSFPAPPSVRVEFDVTGPPRKRIEGVLPGDTTLAREGSPFQVGCDLVVPEGTTLLIEPGVELMFASTYWGIESRLIVRGTLIAKGTPESKIILRSYGGDPRPSDWGGILIERSARDPQYVPERGGYVDGCVLEHCIISHASTPIRIVGASPVISNCIIRNNGDRRAQSPNPDLIVAEESYATFINTTVVANSGIVSGGFTYVNCIIWHNENLQLGWFFAEHSNIQGGYPGPGNIDADPLFVDLAGQDYHLRPDSPCVDAGTREVQGIAEQDVDGEARVLGDNIDMGADEVADSDGDFLPDYLEVFYLGSLLWGPDDDPDSDGMTISDEIVCGTNPSDPISYLRVTEVMPFPVVTFVSWNGLPGRKYLVHRSDDMQNWLCVSPVIMGDDWGFLQDTEFSDRSEHPLGRCFYKVEVLP